jgi:hypothetical protein
VLIVGVTSWSGEGVRSQVPGGGVRSYVGLTLVTVALLSLFYSHKRKDTRGSKKELQYLAAGTSRRPSPSAGVH